MNLDLSINEDEEILRSAALNFLERDVPKDTLQELHDSDTGINKTIWGKVVDMGWLGMIIPEEYGGVGYPLLSAGVLFETLGSAPLPGPYFSSGILGALIIIEAGTEEQKQEILPQVTSGEIVLSAAITEAEYGWEADTIEASAQNSSGGITLNGTKLFVLEAGAATHFIVAAQDGDGISLFMVDAASEGVAIRRLPGYLAGRNYEVTLNNVKLSEKDRLGDSGAGWPAVLKAMEKAIPILSAYKVGGCQAVFDMTVEYSRVRVQFGQAIGRFQRVQDLIIEILNQTDSARWTTYETLWKLDTGQDVSLSVPVAKAVASEAYWQVCSLGHRAISGISYSMEHPLALHTRSSRHLYNFLGEPAHHRQKLARMLIA